MTPFEASTVSVSRMNSFLTGRDLQQTSWGWWEEDSTKARCVLETGINYNGWLNGRLCVCWIQSWIWFHRSLSFAGITLYENTLLSFFKNFDVNSQLYLRILEQLQTFSQFPALPFTPSPAEILSAAGPLGQDHQSGANSKAPREAKES